MTVSVWCGTASVVVGGICGCTLLRLDQDCLLPLREWLCHHLLLDLYHLLGHVWDLILLFQEDLTLLLPLDQCGLKNFLHKLVQ